MPKILFPEHHVSHAASAFHPSPFAEAAILTVDGVGEWATTLIAHGEGRNIRTIKEMQFPHSLGLLYSAFTYYCGFKVNGGEQKLMGLAPYGEKGSGRVTAYKNKILTELIDLKDDGSFFLNLEYFTFTVAPTMTNDTRFETLFGLPRRVPETEIAQEYKDLALAIQEVTEEIMLRLATTAQTLTGSSNLVLAGGAALNCVANAKILDDGPFKRIWIQPAAGDAGGALGAAFAAHHVYFREQRHVVGKTDAMKASYLGPEYSETDIEELMAYGAIGEAYDDEALFEHIAGLLATGAVVGWSQGRMEWGPRALGNRSILADARISNMRQKLNEKIKRRETFRPFAPSVLESDVREYFVRGQHSPYMLFTDTVLESRRSEIPAVTHVDGSARVHTVAEYVNPRLFRLLQEFKSITGCSLLINTSLNVRGEPIAMTPKDAYRCFMETDMDYMVVDNFVFNKKQQPTNDAVRMKFYVLD